MDNGDILSFVGSLIGAAAAVGGAVWVEHYKRGLEAKSYKKLLSDALGAFETNLADIEQQYTRYIKGNPDLPAAKDGIVSILPNLDEAEDLLSDSSVAVTTGNYEQRRSLYRLGKALRQNAHIFEGEAQIVGRFDATERILKVHFAKVRPAADEVRQAVVAAQKAWR